MPSCWWSYFVFCCFVRVRQCSGFEATGLASPTTGSYRRYSGVCGIHGLPDLRAGTSMRSMHEECSFSFEFPHIMHEVLAIRRCALRFFETSTYDKF